MPARLRRFLPLFAVLLYAVFVAWLTWPALGQLGSAIPGHDGDAFVHLWTYDWVKDAFLSGQSPFHTTRLFYPNGVDMYTHNFAWANIAAWLPLQALLGEAAAYTLTFLMVPVLNGTAVFFLVRHLTRHDLAALLAGFIATGWPYIISRSSQPNLIFIACLPLALLALHRLTLSGRWLDALWLALALAGLGLSRYQLLIMSVPILLAAALYWLWVSDLPPRRLLPQFVAAAFLAAVLLAPTAGPVLAYQATRDNAADIIPDEEPWGEADLLGYFLPAPDAPGGALITERLPGLLTRTPIGWVTLLLAGLGLFTPHRDKWLWLGLALGIWLLALGRVLTINGQTTLPLPYAWLETHVPLVSLIRYPSRYTALLVVPVAVLAGYGFTWIAARLDRRWTAVVAALLLLLVAVEDNVSAYPMLPLETPAWYAGLGADAQEYGLVTVPLERAFDEVAMTYQLTANKPLVEGHVSRPPREAFTFIESTPFLAALSDTVTAPPAEIGDIAAQLAPLAAANLPYVVIHKRYITPAEASAWRLWFGIPPRHEDDEVLVYATDLQEGFDFEAQESGLAGVRFVAGQIVPPALRPGEEATVVAHWALDAGAAPSWSSCVVLQDGGGAAVAESCAPLVLPVPAAGQGQLGRTEQVLAFAEPLADGRYEAVLTLSDSAHSSVPLSLGPLYVTSGARQFTLPQPQTETAVSFGDSLALLGFDGPRLANQTLDLTLFWQDVQETDISYKVFLHVIDAASGALVAQLDTVPRDWAYPTNTWHAGEVVSDRLALPLAAVPPGDYELRVGLYDPATGERLPVSSADGRDAANNSLLLTTFAVGD